MYFVPELHQTQIITAAVPGPYSPAHGLGAKQMTTYETIIAAYPELLNKDLLSEGIFLQDDSDNKGVFIVEWNYSKPLPSGLKIGK